MYSKIKHNYTIYHNNDILIKYLSSVAIYCHRIFKALHANLATSGSITAQFNSKQNFNWQLQTLSKKQIFLYKLTM